MRNYQKIYAIDLQVTNNVLARIHAFLESGPHKDKTCMYNSFLRIKNAFNNVKRKTDKLSSLDLPGVDFCLDEISNFPLIFNRSCLTKDFDQPLGGLPLSHLKD